MSCWRLDLRPRAREAPVNASPTKHRGVSSLISGLEHSRLRLCGLPERRGLIEDRFTAAVNAAADVDAIMKVYVPDESLVVFDIMPPRQYLGANAYRKDWVDFLAIFSGPPKFDITDLSIAAEGNLGFSHSIQRVRGSDTKGQPVDVTVRVTDGYRKIGGNWLIVLSTPAMTDH